MYHLNEWINHCKWRVWWGLKQISVYAILFWSTQLYRFLVDLLIPNLSRFSKLVNMFKHIINFLNTFSLQVSSIKIGKPRLHKMSSTNAHKTRAKMSTTFSSPLPPSPISIMCATYKRKTLRSDNTTSRVGKRYPICTI